MKTRSTTFLLLVVFLLLGFNAGYLFGQSPLAPVQLFGAVQVPEEARNAFAPFWEVWDLVQTSYYNQPVDQDLLAEGAINGMLAALEDENTRYLSPTDEAAARQDMAGELQGIGAEVTNENGRIVIVSPIAASPAEAAGLQPGDVILSADGFDLSGMDAFEAASIVRGPAGTAVTLLIERAGEQFEVEVVRDVIRIASATGEMLADNIAYVRLNRFGDQTAPELETVLNELMPQSPSGLILDLRRNPGGALDTALDVADQFLPQTLVMTERFGDGFEREFSVTDDGLAQSIPMVVLIDEGSASASEVLAGAIHDLDRGTLIGQTSFGKGTVQTWHGLSNQGGVRITVARWLTPDGQWVHGDGLNPDIFIPLPEFDPGVPFEDTQLQAAIDFLSGKEVLSIPPTEVEQSNQ